MKRELCEAFCNELIVREMASGFAVSTGFSYPDGDRIGFYVKTNESGGFEIQDNGLVFPNLEASGLDRSNKARAEALTTLMHEYDVFLDEDDREFKLAGNDAHALPGAALRFVSFLLRVGDLLLMAEERVASTFRLDVEAIARGLSEAQRTAIIDCAKFLDWAAGEGFCIHVGHQDMPDGSRRREYLGADDCLYNLWLAFDLPNPAETYTDAVREVLIRDAVSQQGHR